MCGMRLRVDLSRRKTEWFEGTKSSHPCASTNNIASGMRAEHINSTPNCVTYGSEWTNRIKCDLRSF